MDIALLRLSDPWNGKPWNGKCIRDSRYATRHAICDVRTAMSAMTGEISTEGSASCHI
jgi:hypothetical protein